MMTSLAQEFKFLRKTGRSASFGSSEGHYPFFTSSQEVTKRTDVTDYKGPALVFGDGGAASLHYVDGPFSATNHCYIAVPKNGRAEDAKFFYHFLRKNMAPPRFVWVAARSLSPRRPRWEGRRAMLADGSVCPRSSTRS